MIVALLLPIYTTIVVVVEATIQTVVAMLVYTTIITISTSKGLVSSII